MNPFQSQLLFQDGETLSEKAARHYTGVNPPLAAQKVTVEEFEHSRPQKQLHVFSNSVDCVIAESAEDAISVWEDVTGENWGQEPDEKEISITYVDEPGQPKQTHTCGEWVKRFGRGWLSSTEY
jgi:hypothetical protein